MAGLYNMLHGVNGSSDLILGALGLTRDTVGRFRDVFVTDKDEIAVYTRNGGGNREQYQDTIDELSRHPCYLRDADDEFDCTYCTIYFKFPDEFAERLRAMASGPFDPDKLWADTLEAIRTMPIPPPKEKK